MPRVMSGVSKLLLSLLLLDWLPAEWLVGVEAALVVVDVAVS